jgi:hybrid polyketide synthase/nonribosomal peptide synthetase ACE1
VDHPATVTAAVTPFVFSAATEASLVAQLTAYADYLQTEAAHDVDAADLAWTLQTRRSQFAYRAAFSATSTAQLKAKIEATLAKAGGTDRRGAAPPVGTLVTAKSTTSNRVLGVFTGQGAQWATMGAQLVKASVWVRARIRELEHALTTLPEADRPTWSLAGELLADESASRMAQADISQPLCTVVQIVLVDLLRTAGVVFSAVVGHSSGEIAAAYAAGFLSATDAVRVAYYRGFHAKLAGNKATGQKGAMLAVGASVAEVHDLLRLRAFRGRLALAAHNSNASVTLSGDADAIAKAKSIFDEEKRFARLLKVDTAYHSHHMLPCSDVYLASIRAAGVTCGPGNPECAWYSSVIPGQSAPMQPSDALVDVYWRDNMTGTVLFNDAVCNALAADDTLALAVEVGPHPALKGPASQAAADLRPAGFPYVGCLSRGVDDVEAFADTLGFLWTHLGARNVDLDAYSKRINGEQYCPPRLVTGLPSYRWNHERSYWSESRTSRRLRQRSQPPHELLGVVLPDTNSHELRWSNVLRVSEIEWLQGHQLQGQTVFPAAGYVAMALEASRALAGEQPIELMEVLDLEIPKAIAFNDSQSAGGVETLVTLTEVRREGTTVTANFSCYSTPVVQSAPASQSAQDMALVVRARVAVTLGAPRVDALATNDVTEKYNLAPVDIDNFYGALSKLGYSYSGPFRTLSDMQRRLDYASAVVGSYVYSADEKAAGTSYLVHPAPLDVAFQSWMLTFAAPGDGRLRALHVPTGIGRIRVNPAVCAMVPQSQSGLPVVSVVDSDADKSPASISLFGPDGGHSMVQIEDFVMSPFAPPSEADDHRMFTYMAVESAEPDGIAAMSARKPSADQIRLGEVIERVAYYYLRKWDRELSEADWDASQPHFAHLRNWVKHSLAWVARGDHPLVRKEWITDTSDDIQELASAHVDTVEVRMLQAVGEHMVPSVRGDTTILEHMRAGGLLDEFYTNTLCLDVYNQSLANMTKQITYRYPHARVLEIGAGVGSVTRAVLANIGDTIASYTYTDISVGFFSDAAKTFSAYRDKMTYKLFDVEKSPDLQGFQPHSYDIIIASNVLHATTSLQVTLENTRRLLRPGGWLVMLEVTEPDTLRSGAVMGGLPGWWLGASDGRALSPVVPASTWHTMLRKTGFAGIDTMTPTPNKLDRSAWVFSVLASQAVDKRVAFLRRPLSAPPPKDKPSMTMETLVILGGLTLGSSRIADALAEQVGDRFADEIITLEGLPTEADMARLPPQSIFVNLVDLDAAIFDNVTEEKMDGLKRVWELAAHVLWITNGGRGQQPYHGASLAFCRSLRNEVKHVALSVLDVADMDTPNLGNAVAEHLLRDVALYRWGVSPTGDAAKTGQDDVLYSREMEAYLDTNGRIQIPRLLRDVERDARLNTSSRSIYTTAPVSDVQVQLLPTLRPTLAQRLLAATATEASAGQPTVQLESSSLAALHVAANHFYFVGVGHNASTPTQRFVVFSPDNALTPTPCMSVPLATDLSADAVLVAVASELLAASLLAPLSLGHGLVLRVSRGDRFLTRAVQRKAAAKGVLVTFISTQDSKGADPMWTCISMGSSMHAIRKALQSAKATHFLDLTAGITTTTTTDDLGLRIFQALPVGTRHLDVAALFSVRASIPSSSSPLALPVLAGLIEDAIAQAWSSVDLDDLSDVVVPIGQSLDKPTNPRHHPLASGVRWPVKSTDTVRVPVSPVHRHGLFRRDRTYLLVGLTGAIGQSLCTFMVANGAGCVCLMSRNVALDPAWVDSFAHMGAMVKAIPCDVTDLAIIKRIIGQIRETLPPIAGVANGAMVLHDSLFANMTADTMRTVLQPKVNGSIHLDGLFGVDDEPLDFFVLFSSASAIIGNAGQSNYCAANGFLIGLARSRCLRGLAGSVLDIGVVVGIGYVEASAAQAARNQLARQGLDVLSEPELRQAFAEAVLSSHPHPHRAVQGPKRLQQVAVSTGVRVYHIDEDVSGPWFTQPLFSHCVVVGGRADADGGAVSADNASSLPISQQLARVSSRADALVALEDAFGSRLRHVLQLDDAPIQPDTPLVELGIDSLVAVEVRSWFLKELKLDIPVLQLVSGASLREIVNEAVGKLPEGLLGSAAKGDVKDKVNGEVGKSHGQAVNGLATKADKKMNGILVQSDAPSASTEDCADDSGARMQSESTTASTTTIPARTPSTTPSTTGNNSPLTDATTDCPTITSPTVPRRILKTEPMSLSQSRYWYLRHLVQDPRAGNVAFYYRIDGPLRAAALERAVRIVTTRHEILRTAFVADPEDPSQAVQEVLATSRIQLECRHAASSADVLAVYAHLRTHVFDLGSGRLMRIVLVTTSLTEHWLLFLYHHIIFDGISFQILLSDLEKAYVGQSLGPPPRQYPAFSAAQRRALEAGEFHKELAYWRSVFPQDDMPPVLPLLPMARVSSRVRSKDFAMHDARLHLSSELAGRIRSVARANRTTPFHLYLATFRALLMRFGRSSDVTIGIADGARNDADVEGSMGLFLNLLPLRFRSPSTQTFEAALVEARDLCHAALATSRLPFDVLLAEFAVDRSATHSPFFQAFLDYRQGAQESHAFADCQFNWCEAHGAPSVYDILLDVTDHVNGALLVVRAQKSLYDVDGTTLILKAFVHFLEALSANPEQPLADVPLYSPEQLSQATTIGRGPELTSDWPATLVHRVEDMAQKYPELVALVDGNEQPLSYAAMLDRIRAISEALQQHRGVGIGTRVLVFQKATCDWVCSMLAVMLIGGVYVPLDTRNPLSRLAVVARDCAPGAVLVDSLTSLSAPDLQLPSSTVIIDVSTLGRKASSLIQNGAEADVLAAILYTSGSTGTPKGIMVTHDGLRNEIEGYTKTWSLGAEHTLQQSAFTFNHSLDQIFTGLVNGGTVIIVPDERRGDPLEVTSMVQKHSITYTKATPSEYLMWLESSAENLRLASAWRFAFAGGEPLTSVVTQKFAALKLPELCLFNSYGPTEISISSHKMEIAYRQPQPDADVATARIPCGYSLPNYHTYVLDEQLQPLPAGMAGEVYIGGAGVSRGYLNNDNLTAQHFVSNPFATSADLAHGWSRMYRTGDIGHLTHNGGALVFHRRIEGDSQVKIRGLRIELSDIEANIIAAAHGTLREAVVTLREGDAGFLAGHVVFTSTWTVKGDDERAAFLAQLLERLPVPQYMRPVLLVSVDRLPLSGHAKIDRKAARKLPLLAPGRFAWGAVNDDGATVSTASELTETMIQLRQLWRSVLGEEREKLGLTITPSSSFFSIGGNSLLVIRLQARIRATFNVALRLIDMLEANTLAAMARRIEEAAPVDDINWEQETALPKPLLLDSEASYGYNNDSNKKTILVTGATGFLGRHILPVLLARDDVALIHCLAVRNPQKLPSPTAGSAKLVVHAGDLSLPQLGLSESNLDTLAHSADAILHLGGARSFWDSYHVLRPSSVAPMAELIAIAAPRQVSIHYVSTAGVLPRFIAAHGQTAKSAADHAPPADGSDGYVASRWASERLLERAGAELSVPGTIYRFVTTSESTHEQHQKEASLAAHKAVLDELVRFVSIAGLVPEFSTWSGHIDLAPVVEVAHWLSERVVTPVGSVQRITSFEHCTGTVSITVDQVRAHLEKSLRASDWDLPRLPVLKWMGRLKSLGFGWIVTSQDASAVEPTGLIFKTRR